MRVIFIFLFLTISQIALVGQVNDTIQKIKHNKHSISFSIGAKGGNIIFLPADQFTNREIFSASLLLKYSYVLNKYIHLFSDISDMGFDGDLNLEQSSSSLQDPHITIKKTYKTKFRNHLIYTIIGPEFRIGKKVQFYVNYGIGLAYHFGVEHTSGYVAIDGLDNEYTRITVPNNDFENTFSLAHGYTLGLERHFELTGIFICFNHIQTNKPQKTNDFYYKYSLSSVQLGIKFKF